jgi:hypothetical protein
MADVEFSHDDIVSLIAKISTLQPDLSDQERQLLMSIFALAAEHSMPADGPRQVTLPEPAEPDEPSPVVDGSATVAELQQQLLDAYTPDTSSDTVAGEHELHEHELAPSYTLVRHSIHRHSIHQTAAAEPEEG